MPKILLVEDDNNLREIFEMRLQAENYKTVTASDGEEALVVAMKEKPDLIIADVMMPKLSGFEMLETLRAAPEMGDTKVVMMTALGQAEDRTRGESLGVIKYLVKSQVTLEDFVRVVREVLQPDQADAGTPPAPATDSGETSPIINKQERERTMQDDNTQPTNQPADGADAPSSNPASGDSANANEQQSTEEEKDTVTQQVNDFAGGAPTMSSPPAGDEDSSSDSSSNSEGGLGTSVPGTDAPVSSPPTDGAGDDGHADDGSQNPTGPAQGSGDNTQA
ncbi:response regulator [Candidatus Saccharibacteria bacterium]|nr:response regulator [Candidatus Saccharibacteria bacterium]